MNSISKEREEEILLAIDMWRESGLSQGAFCRRENIARSTFQSWRRKYDTTDYYDTTPTTETESFLSVELSSSGSAPSSSSQLEIVYPNGVKLNYDFSMGLSILSKLINLPIG